MQGVHTININPSYTAMSQKTSARLRELSTELGTISRNLADVFLDIPVSCTRAGALVTRYCGMSILFQMRSCC